MTLPSPSNFDPQPSEKIDYSSESARDVEQLSLLSTFHYIVGGLLMLMSCVFIVLILAGLDQMQVHPQKRMFNDLLVISGAVAIVLGWIISGLLMLSAYCIDHRRSRNFTLFLSVISLLLFPFGTLLGICTFFILRRGSVRLLYSDK